MPLDVLGLVFPAKPRTEIAGGDLDVPLDVAISTVHSFRNVLTGEPIEDGSEIHDHVIAEPEVLTIEGLVTDHPTSILGANLGGALGAAAGGLVGAGGLGSTALALGGAAIADLAGGDAPSLQAYKLLVGAWRDASLLRIVTRYDTFEDMVIESLEIPHSAPVGQALRFTATFRKVIKVASREVSVSLVDVVSGIADAASSTVDRGRVAAATPDGSTLADVGDFRLEMGF